MTTRLRLPRSQVIRSVHRAGKQQGRKRKGPTVGATWELDRCKYEPSDKAGRFCACEQAHSACLSPTSLGRKYNNRTTTGEVEETDTKSNHSFLTVKQQSSRRAPLTFARRCCCQRSQDYMIMFLLECVMLPKKFPSATRMCSVTMQCVQEKKRRRMRTR